LPTNSALRAFAESPNAYLPAPEGALVVDDERFHLSVSSDGTYAAVCRVRTDDLARVFAVVHSAAPRARVTWTVADPALEPELCALGCHDVDPPLTSHITALATDAEPPVVGGVEVRRIATYEQFVVGLEVSRSGWQTEGMEDPEAAWQRRSSRPGGEWLALIDAEPVAYAGAIAGPTGLFLTGGVTVERARGRGAYRALVRARWDEAVRRGTPALVVHAEDASRRVLERIGFVRVCDIVELVSDPQAT
jgi:hypothetical protein